MKDSDIFACIIIAIGIPILFGFALIGVSLNAESFCDANEYFESKNFTLEKMKGIDIYGYWENPRVVKLRYPEFVDMADELNVTKIYLEYSSDKHDYDFWFYSEGIRYQVWEKWYVPKETTS